MSTPEQTSLHHPGLLERVAAGDAGAVEDVVNAHAAMVWRVVRRRLGPNHPDLEDAIQDTFADVWRSAPRFDPSRGSEAAFIASIAARRAIDIRRRRVPRPWSDTHTHAADPDGTGNATGSDAELNAALGGLRGEEQDALRLRYHAGMSYEQIASVLDTKPATIRGWVFRGLRRLRDRLPSQASEDHARSKEADHV